MIFLKLFKAAEYNRKNITRLLLENNACRIIKDDYGVTPLHIGKF